MPSLPHAPADGPATPRSAHACRARRRSQRGQLLVIGTLVMVVLVAMGGLALDGAQDLDSGVVLQAAADATSTSAATFWGGENPTAAPNTSDAVGPRAAAIAAVN